MIDPFMNLGRCARMATRQAFRTGNVHHVIATGSVAMPMAVIDEHQLFDLGDRLDLTDPLFSADPFAEAEAG